MLTIVLLQEMLVSATAAPGEFDAAQRFGGASVQEAMQCPFSFVYGEQASADLLRSWPVERVAGESDGEREVEVVRWREAASGLECRWEVTRFLDFPVVEWVVYFKNSGTAETRIIKDIQALDCGLPLARDKGAQVHYAKGSECRLDDFAPQVASLGPNENDPQGAWVGEGNPFRMESKSGRSSCGTLPFFNVAMGDHGAIGAIGWTGDWTAAFYRTDTEVRMRAGMRRTHLKLLPGEEIRSPRMALLFWEGERMHGHNLWRQFVLAHHSPKVNGQRAQAPVSCATWGGNFADKHIEHGKWWKEQGLPLDFLWVDAGWFGADEAKAGANVFNSQWWRYVGDWHANPGYFPEGLKPVGEALNAMGLGFLLWLEPERVYKDTRWTREHPEWLLGPMGDNSLFNLGIAEARAMLLGADILGSGFNLEVEIFQGSGAFVCGEETALIRSVAGYRGMPHPRPPFPAEKGIDGHPTVINNVKTLAALPPIIGNGAGLVPDDGNCGQPRHGYFFGGRRCAPPRPGGNPHGDLPAHPDFRYLRRDPQQEAVQGGPDRGPLGRLPAGGVPGHPHRF